MFLPPSSHLKFPSSLCLKTYNTTVANGRTITEVTDTQSPTFSEQVLKVSADPGESPMTKITTKDANGTEYYMETGTRESFTAYLAVAVFFGTTEESDAASAFGDLFDNNPPSDHLAAIRPLLTNLETSMSNALRTTSNNQSNVFGIANYDEIYISVNFRWLILPMLSIALSLIFLVAVALVTRRREVPLWKDGLGKALCALEPETRIRMEGLNDGKDGARNVPIVFERDGGRGWWLRGPGEEWWTRK